MSKLHSFKDVHKQWGITIPMLKKLHQQRTIEVVKIGAKNFISEQTIENYIKANTISAKS